MLYMKEIDIIQQSEQVYDNFINQSWEGRRAINFHIKSKFLWRNYVRGLTSFHLWSHWMTSTLKSCDDIHFNVLLYYHNIFK